MTIASITSNPSQDTYAGLNATRKVAGDTAEGASQDRFLKLLVSQLKNQDPLNPMDNAQMTSQLAQISTVDGISKLNATLQALLDGSNQNQALQAATLVGHGVLVPGASLQMQGGAAVGGVELAEPADRVTVSIKDSTGATMKTIELGGLNAGSRGFTWDGSTDSGASAADGRYSISIKAARGDTAVAAKPLELGIVSSVASNSQGASLNVGALGMFKMSDVREIL